MNKTVCKCWTIAAVAIVACTLSGCSTLNVFEQHAATAALRQSSLQSQSSLHGSIAVERGKPRPIIDRVGKVFGIPNQVALGDQRVDNHSISAATEQEVVAYLEDQQLNSVLVRLNQYDPLGELRRIRANKDIRPVWKLTAGSYNWLKYTLLPGRITGGDWYNPYSQSLNLYSDVAPLAVSRAAYAKDVQSRVNPGAYAAISEIPGLGLKHETEATQLAIDWYSNHRPQELESAKDVLYPNYGASWGGQLGSFLPYGEVIGRLAGGLSGRAINAVRK